MALWFVALNSQVARMPSLPTNFCCPSNLIAVKYQEAQCPISYCLYPLLWLLSLLLSIFALLQFNGGVYSFRKPTNISNNQVARPGGTMKSSRCWVDTSTRHNMIMLCKAPSFAVSCGKQSQSTNGCSFSSVIFICIYACIYCWVHVRGYTLGKVCRLPIKVQS